MYTGFKVNTSISKSNVSGLNESQLQSLQREVDTYTRKLQLQKRKYFAIQDQYKAVTEQYGAEKSKLNLLKKENTKAESIMLQTKIKNLEATLDKAVSAYDDTVAYNNRLKGEIDMIRREKKNYQEMQRILQEQLKKINQQTDQKILSLNKKKQKVEELKQQVVQIKNINAQERSETIQKFQDLEKEYLKNANNGDITSSKLKTNELLAPSSTGKPQMIDTQPLLKFRLKKIIASNKQKLRLIDQYKKHMMSIEQAFKEIKEKSHITDLNEITATFIKSEQQNQSLYNYMDYLAQEIDRFDEENRQLQNKIQQKNNHQRENQLESSTKSQNSNSDQFAMPNNLQQKNSDVEEQFRQNQIKAENLKILVTSIQSTLKDALIELSNSQITTSQDKALRSQQQLEGMNINITELNIKDYLARLQDHINNLLQVKQQAPRQTTNFIKQNATSYSKPLPSSSYDELRENGKGQKEDKKEDSKFFNDKNSIHMLSKEMDLEKSRKNR